MSGRFAKNQDKPQKRLSSAYVQPGANKFVTRGCTSTAISPINPVSGKTVGVYFERPVYKVDTPTVD